jgi:hypothetical protein
MVRFATGFIFAVVLLGIAAAGYLYSGQFDVSASRADNALTQWTLHTAMERSVAQAARSIGDPPVFTDHMALHGFEHFDEMCTGCHGGPGIERSEIGKGLNPQAPDLAKAVKTWTPQELFWIVKNGVKMTGMPSFGATHDDKEVWNVIALIEKLPTMTPEQYQQMKAMPPPEPHEHMH